VDEKPFVGNPIAKSPICSVPAIADPVLYAKGRAVAMTYIF
jgi:hypothetical protein